MSPQRHISLAVALDGAGWHPAAWRRAGRPPERAVHRRLLGRPGRRGRARPARLRHHRGRARPPVRPIRSTRTTRTDQVRGRLDAVLDRRPRRAADPTHRRWSRPSIVTHTEPFHVSKAIATLDYVSSGRAGVRVQVGGPAGTRPRTSAAATRARRHRAERRRPRVRAGTLAELLRRGRRLRRGACAGCGTAGRTTPRSATSPPAGSSTATSCTTSTSRAAVQRARARRSPRARRRASRSSTALAHAPLPVPAGRPARPTSVFVTPHDDAPGRRDRRGDPRREQHRRPVGRHRCTSSPTWWSFLDDDRGRAPDTQGPARRSSTGHEFTQRRAGSSPGPPPSWPTCSTGVARGRADRLPAAPGRRSRTTSPRSPAAWCPSCSAAALFRDRLRRRHPARTARPAPPGQPLRSRLTERRTARHHRSRTQADPPRRALPRRQQHHRVERPGGRQPHRVRARSSTSRRPPSAPSSTSSSSPRGCGCASRAGRSTTSTSSAGPTRSPCSPRWPPSPTTSAWPAPSTRPSTSPTRWPASSPRLDHLSGGRAAWNVVTSWDAFTGENFRRGGFLAAGRALRAGQEFLQTTHRAVRLLARRRDRRRPGDRHVPRPTPGAGRSPTTTSSSTSPASSTSRAARRAAR